MKKLIRKVKRILKITNVMCVVEYNNPLSISQFTALMQNMVNKFPGNCKPTSISGRPGSTKIEVDFREACITEDVIIRASDMTLNGINQPNPVKSVNINML